MARRVFVIRDGVAVDKALAPPLHSGRAAPMIRADGMDPIRSQLDGKMYDSRSNYYASLKAAGAEIVGNDRAPFDRRPTFEPQGVKQDMQRAIAQLEARR